MLIVPLLLAARPGYALDAGERRCLRLLEIGVRGRYDWVKSYALHFGLHQALCTAGKQVTVLGDDTLDGFVAAKNKLCSGPPRLPQAGGLTPEEYVLLAKHVVAPAALAAWTACLAIKPPSEGSEFRVERADDAVTLKARFAPSPGAQTSTLNRDVTIYGATCVPQRLRKGVKLTGEWTVSKCRASLPDVAAVLDTTAGGFLKVVERRDDNPDARACLEQEDDKACGCYADRLESHGAGQPDLERMRRVQIIRDAIIVIGQLRNVCSSPAYGPSSQQCNDVRMRYQQVRMMFESLTQNDHYNPDHPFDSGF